MLLRVGEIGEGERAGKDGVVEMRGLRGMMVRSEGGGIDGGN